MRVVYPVAVDNDYAIWRAFKNHYWPALYFVDAQGRVRHHHFGEGDYEQSEKVIQRLLAETGVDDLGQELVSVEARGAEAAADWGSLKSPENYVGYDRAENFASPGGAVLGKRRVYAAPARLGLNQWALSGDWTVGKGAAVLNEADGGRVQPRRHRPRGADVARRPRLRLPPGPGERQKTPARLLARPRAVRQDLGDDPGRARAAES